MSGISIAGTKSRSMLIATGVGAAVMLVGAAPGNGLRQPEQPALGSRIAPIISRDGQRFRDLDRDGRVSPFEDWRLPAKVRADDLVRRMTLEEKAGAMMFPVMGTPAQVTGSLVNSVLSRTREAPGRLADQNNFLQEFAERTRLAIPVTIATDPRNRFTKTFGMSVDSIGFSQWPDEPGFAAAGDAALVRRFGDIVRQEYLAVGFTMALSPQADISTDPRWARNSGTFGDDPQRAGAMAAAYVEGVQGGARGVMRTGLAAIVKHFAGYGAAQDGWDSHSRYGRLATFPGSRFDEHVSAFRPSFRAGVSGVMPTYSILQLRGHPKVGGGFNSVLLTDILRGREQYAGLILSDWSITEDCVPACRGGPPQPGEKPSIGKPWGVEQLSRAERVLLAIRAGVDQIGLDAGGDAVDSTPIVEAARSGAISQARINAAVRRIMIPKFETGLFENPYVDVAAATRIVGQPAFKAAALDAQRRSLVLLEDRGDILPLRAARKRVFLRGVDADTARRFGLEVVERPEVADLAILRVAAPYQTAHPTYFFGRTQHEGDLDFKPNSQDLAAVRAAAAAGIPVIVSIYLERPAIVTPLRPLSAALIGDFGASDQALLDMVTGRARPTGKLPFQLPSSMESVRAQRSDVPNDLVAPLYDRGFGLTYRARPGRN